MCSTKTKKMKKTIILLMSFVAVLVLTSARKPKTTVYIIGDSTAANKDISNGKQERGWGMVLQGFFSEEVRIENHAVNGRSSKSFIDEGRWDRVLERLTPGDYVFIQFGHNDEKPQPERHTVPGTTFDENLRKFVTQTQAKGGIPVLFTPVVRRNFYLVPEKQEDDELLRNTTYTGEKVNSDTLVDTHGAYLLSPKKVACETGCIFIDANRITHDIEQGLGVEGSRSLHMWFRPGEHPSLPDGRQDNTHYNVYGAHIVASALASAIAEKIPDLGKYVRHYDYIVAADGTGNYMTPEDAVEAVPEGASTEVLILNGTFAKPYVPKSKKIRFVFFGGLKFK